jgi:hypothetical protein
MDTSKIIAKIKEHLGYGSRIHPTRDWLALLSFALIIFAGILVWNVWAFSTVVQGGVIGATASTTPPVFSQSSLDAIRSVFAQRSAEEAKYQTGVYRFADPSQ